MSEHDTDIALWSERQGKLLRRRAGGELVNEAEFDWQNIVEEIESLGRSARSAIKNRISRIIEHLAKFEASAAADPRAGWIETVVRSRSELETLLDDSPSLRSQVDAFVSGVHRGALRVVEASLVAHGEVPRMALAEIRYSTEQVLGQWLP